MRNIRNLNMSINPILHVLSQPRFHNVDIAKSSYLFNHGGQEPYLPILVRVWDYSDEPRAIEPRVPLGMSLSLKRIHGLDPADIRAKTDYARALGNEGEFGWPVERRQPFPNGSYLS